MARPCVWSGMITALRCCFKHAWLHVALYDMLTCGVLYCRRKAMLALSCLTRHSDPAMGAFRDQDGLQLLLRTAADVSDPRQQRYFCMHAAVP